MTCIVCGRNKGYFAGHKLSFGFCLPLYEDNILPPSWQGEWAGFDACPLCYRLFSNISEPLEIYKAKEMLQIFLSIIFRKSDKNGF